MRKFKSIMQNAIMYALAIVLVGGTPMAAFAVDEPETYTYDATTGRWSSSKWVYDPATDVYVPAPPSQTPPPEVQDEVKADDSSKAALTEAGTSVDENLDVSSETDIKNGTNVINGVNTDSTTGDAGVKSNNKAGGATSGSADADATIINSVHSTVGGETSGIAHFTTNIYGDVVGDITIGPSIENAQVNQDIDINSKTNVDNDDAITNDVKVNSTSGDAVVSKNTEAGSAKSGNANAVANVLNLINTVIGANKSFVGTINIYGNLNGDILVSPEFIPQLLADNSVSRTEIDMPVALNLNNDQNIVNNVTLNATTGDANVDNNTGAGSATSGTAQTKLTVLNLTGRQVNAKNSLLVFVNVLGKWVGMIVDAPNATAAAIGNGVTTNTSISASDTTNVNSKAKITNNIDLSAKSGDASVTDNTSAGDAESGNATASANIANIETSTFELSDWFGVLFINVFGTWVGSFGIDTEAGTIVPLSVGAQSGSTPTNGAPNLQFGFTPKNISEAKDALATLETGNASFDSEGAAALLANQSTTPGVSSFQPTARQKSDPFSALMTVGGFMVAGMYGAGYGLRRWRESRSTIIATPNNTGLALPQ